MAEVKKTQKDFYARLIEIIGDANPHDKEELIKFCKGRVELIVKKNSGGKKANPLTELTREFVENYLEEHPHEIVTCSQLADKMTKAKNLDEPITSQRVSTIMKVLVAEGFAEKVKGSQYKKAE